MVLKKENQIYRRQLIPRKIQSNLKRRDRFHISLLKKLSKRAKNHLAIVKPTLLTYKRRVLKNYWTYKHSKPGRKPVSAEIKKLILQIMLDNGLWGCHRIADD
jgi:hypothetical protein